MSVKVCIFGQKDNGKTTLAQMIQSSIYNIQSGALDPIPIRSFAYAFKKVVSDLSGIPLDALEYYKRNNQKPPGWTQTVREAYQNIGELGRLINPRMWIDPTIRSVSYIIDDGRHINEIDATYEDNAYNIMIIDPTKINNDPHPSEIHLATLVHDYYKGLKHPRIHEVYLNNHSKERMKLYATSIAKHLIFRAGRNDAKKTRSV